MHQTDIHEQQTAHRDLNEALPINASSTNLLGLASGHDGDGEKLLVDTAIEAENIPHFFICFSLSTDEKESVNSDVRRVNRRPYALRMRVIPDLVGISRVSLLPEEFAGTKERCRLLELPPDYVGPLIQLQARAA